MAITVPHTWPLHSSRFGKPISIQLLPKVTTFGGSNKFSYDDSLWIRNDNGKIHNKNFVFLITARKRCCGKVMFLHVPVILSTGVCIMSLSVWSNVFSGIWCHYRSGPMFLLGGGGMVSERVWYTLPPLGTETDPHWIQRADPCPAIRNYWNAFFLFLFVDILSYMTNINSTTNYHKNIQGIKVSICWSSYIYFNCKGNLHRFYVL